MSERGSVRRNMVKIESEKASELGLRNNPALVNELSDVYLVEKIVKDELKSRSVLLGIKTAIPHQVKNLVEGFKKDSEKTQSMVGFYRENGIDFGEKIIGMIDNPWTSDSAKCAIATLHLGGEIGKKMRETEGRIATAQSLVAGMREQLSPEAKQGLANGVFTTADAHRVKCEMGNTIQSPNQGVAGPKYGI
jgi:hypothetical protein